MGGFLKRLLGSGSDDAGPPVDGDGQVIAALRRAGADLAQPREVIHYLYFGSEPATQAAVARLDRDARFVHARIDPETGKSVVKVTHTAVVTPETIRALRQEFEAVASEGGGEYDGWEAAARP
jgi:hypothetical protein